MRTEAVNCVLDVMHVITTDALRLGPLADRREDTAAGVTASADAATLGHAIEASGLIGLDPRTQALTRVAALIAVESCVTSYQWAIDAALEHGASEEDLIDVLLSIAPLVGLERGDSRGVTARTPHRVLAPPGKVTVFARLPRECSPVAFTRLG